MLSLTVPVVKPLNRLYALLEQLEYHKAHSLRLFQTPLPLHQRKDNHTADTSIEEQPLNRPLVYAAEPPADNQRPLVGLVSALCKDTACRQGTPS